MDYNALPANERPAFWVSKGSPKPGLQTLQQPSEERIRAFMEEQAAKQGKRFDWETRTLVDLD